MHRGSWNSLRQVDGTMKRDDRTRAMDALKHDPGCEVLLVSLRPVSRLKSHCSPTSVPDGSILESAVENQAVDRIVRIRSLLVLRKLLITYCL